MMISHGAPPPVLIDSRYWSVASRQTSWHAVEQVPGSHSLNVGGGEIYKRQDGECTCLIQKISSRFTALVTSNAVASDTT